MKASHPFFLTVFAATAFATYPLSAQADENKLLETDAQAIFQYIGEENNDLGTLSENYEDSLSEQLLVRSKATFNPDFYGYFHGRALNIDGQTGFDDDTGESVAQTDSFLELRELYLRHENLFGINPAFIQVGRQRIREDRAIWWNSDQDLVKAGYESTLFSTFVAAGEDTTSWRIGDDGDYREEDEDRFRVLGEASWQYKYNHFLEGRALYEDDHSGLEAVGSTVDAFDRDNEDQQLFWIGARATGEFRDVITKRFKYRADLISVFGEEDLLTTAAGPTTSTRTVTGSRQRDVRGWAFDGNVIIDPFDFQGPAFTIGYAFATGESNPNGTDTDNEFRQTDLDGNSSRVGLERQQQRNYGEVLRPELSNMKIISAGVNHPVTKSTEVSLTYYNYHLDEAATRLRSSGISAPLNNADKDVGQALDIGLYVDVDDQFDFKMPYTKDVDFRLVGGSFFPGDAYGTHGDHEAFKIFSEVKFRF